MLKKLLMTISAFIAVLVVLVIIAGAIIFTRVDKTFVAARMSESLNRQVYVEKIDVSLFCVLSGIEVKNVAVSNFKTPLELESLQGKPVQPGDVFAGMDAFRFKVKMLPLLARRVELKEVVLYSPVIHLFKNKQGVMNIDEDRKSVV